MSFHTGQTNGFSFNGNSDGADNNNQLVVIRGDGKVGIGTSTPSAVFHVNRPTYSSTERTMKINNGSNNGGAQYDTLLINQPDVPSVRFVETATNQELTLSVGNENSNSAVIGSTGQLVFSVGRAASTLAYSAGGRAMTINSTGQVGIGTHDPIYKLSIDNGTSDGNILRLNNEEVGLNVSVDGSNPTYTSSDRTVTLNATRMDGGAEPTLRLAGQGQIEFAVDANSVKMTLDKDSGFNNTTQLNLHGAYLRRNYEKITEWTAFTHCSTPDNANFLHIRTPLISDTASSGNISAYRPVAIEIYGYHNYAAENFHDCTVVVNTPSNGSFQANLRSDNNNHSSLTVYRSGSTYNGYNRVCLSVPKSTCCCVGALWIRFRWWNGLPTDNYAWGHTGTYNTTDGF